MSTTLDQAPLGKKIEYVNTYSPDLLYSIPRAEQREGLELLPFQGTDIWNAYELSWLNSKGKPQVMLGEFHIPCSSPNLIESKSFKLYLNSFNQVKIDSLQEVAETMGKDLARASGATVRVMLEPLTEGTVNHLQGTCLDGIDVTIDTYKPNPDFLIVGSENVEETVYTNLFKSNCLITGQPDWASVSISYAGAQIDHASLLKYLISYRNHKGFHEHCTEQIFLDIMHYCSPVSLIVIAPFTRRGGISITCIRSITSTESSVIRTIRQ